ncbi:PLC-like phosphodiesterase [Auriculariales sp. MPI-PUGE-AT-0066]|nr:PLC-like phosphodiesterase [Auriculariales sp. MPI-PUGE-AT-0066]
MLTLLFTALLALQPRSIHADQSLPSATFRASHNSYSGNLEGSKSTIQYQLDHGVRMIEFDIWDTNFSSNKDYSIGHTGPGNAVDHTSPNPSSNLLSDWLAVVNSWSAANPTHAPIQMLLDIKTDLTDNANYAAGNLAALNQVVTDAFGSRLLWASNAPAGLPSVDALRGKVLVVLSGDGASRSQYKSDTGSSPSVARNNRGQIVELHDDGGINLWYWSGKVQSDGSVKWLRHGKFDTGITPAVAINDDGWIVEVHRSQVSQTVFSRVGRFDDQTGEIIWGSSSKYDNGVSPSVAFVDGSLTLREIHQSQSNSQRWTWTGQLNTAAMTVTWTGNAKTSDPFYTKTESNGVTVYKDSSSKLVYSSGSFVGKRIAYEQVAFVEFQSGNSAELQDGAIFYAATASDKSFITNARNSGKLVRGWDFDNSTLATTPLANYPATNHPYDSWYETLVTANKAII